jgi:hypothetical protein
MNGRISICCFFLTAFFVISCGKEKGNEPPEGLIDKATMIGILQDVYQVEAKVAALNVPYDSSQRVFNLVEADLLKRHGVNDSLYRISMAYYFENPEELTYIYEAVVDSLSLQERQLTQQDKVTK